MADIFERLGRVLPRLLQQHLLAARVLSTTTTTTITDLSIQLHQRASRLHYKSVNIREHDDVKLNNYLLTLNSKLTLNDVLCE